MDKLAELYEAHRAKAVKTVLGDDLPGWIPDGDVMLIDRAISDFSVQGFLSEEVGGWVCEDADDTHRVTKCHCVGTISADGVL